MAAKTSAVCTICVTYSTIQGFQILVACGHCFCRPCVTSLLKLDEPKCPNCRTPISQGDVQSIYLEVVDPRVAAAYTLIEAIEQMDKDTPKARVDQASQQLVRLLQTPPQNEAALSELHKAVTDFQERIIPMFAQRDREKKLRDQLRGLTAKAKRQDDEIRGLRQLVEEQEDTVRAALSTGTKTVTNRRSSVLRKNGPEKGKGEEKKKGKESKDDCHIQ